jgi:FlaA1/EpsC-like NDP-sugar epimerase
LLVNSGDVHILEMGDPIPLVDIVNRLAQYLGKDFSLVEVGLREGEKLHEELFSSAEKMSKTNFEKVNVIDLPIPKVSFFDFVDSVDSDILAVNRIDGFLKKINA